MDDFDDYAPLAWSGHEPAPLMDRSRRADDGSPFFDDLGLIGGEGYSIDLLDDMVEGVLPEYGVMMITGASGTFKTFGLMRLCKDLATNGRFAGRKILRNGATMYLGYEGYATIGPRLEAIRIEDGDDGRAIPMAVPKNPRSFAGEGAFASFEAALISANRTFQGEFRVNLSFVAVDTAIAAGLVADEMKPEQWQAMWTELAGIAKRQNLLIGVVAHAGKDALQGARGSSASYAGVDVEITFSGVRNAITGDVVGRLMSLTKSREGQTFPLAALSGHDVHVGDTPKRRRKNVMVIDFDTSPEGIAEAEAAQSEARTSKSARKGGDKAESTSPVADRWREAMEYALRGHAAGDLLPGATFREAVCARATMAHNETTNQKKSNFARALERFIKAKRLERVKIEDALSYRVTGNEAGNE